MPTLSIHFPLDMSFKTDELIEKSVGRPSDCAGTNGCARDLGWHLKPLAACAIAVKLRKEFPNIMVKTWEDTNAS